MILPVVLAAALAAEPSGAGGVMTVVATVAPACTVRSTPGGVVLVACAGATPHVVTRPGRPRTPQARPEGPTITF